jgi:hypothetical protein
MSFRVVCLALCLPGISKPPGPLRDNINECDFFQEQSGRQVNDPINTVTHFSGRGETQMNPRKNGPDPHAGLLPPARPFHRRDAKAQRLKCNEPDCLMVRVFASSW